MNNNNRVDAEHLKLLGDLQYLLSAALNSLDTKELSTNTRYLSICAITVNQAAGAFYILRKGSNIYASKMLIRPMVEATISACATLSKQGFLFRKAYTELLEEKKWFPPGPQRENHFNARVVELENIFKNEDPAYPIEHKKVNMKDAAEAAGLTSLYEVVYRLYCRFTHGAIDAALGQLNAMTDNLDTDFAARFTFIMLEQLQINTHANVPDLSQYRARLDVLYLRMHASIIIPPV